MIAVIFDAQPLPGEKYTYLEAAAGGFARRARRLSSTLPMLGHAPMVRERNHANLPPPRS